MDTETVGELLHWSYANLAMAHSALNTGAERYGRPHFMVRARLYAGLKKRTMNIGSLADDERVKMLLPQACCYCGSRESLSLDHLIPRKRGGPDTGDNLVWACRSCNSSKCDRDLLQWMASRDRFPSLLLLRRYLKLVIRICEDSRVMDRPITEAGDLPFALAAIPTAFPPPTHLCLWSTDLP